VGAMVLFLFLPIFHVSLVPPLNENRIRVEFPEENPLYAFWSNPEYARSIETYYNDNYSMRDFLIELKNQIDFSVFNKSDELFIGEDTYLAYKSVIEREQVRNEKADIEHICNKFAELNNTLIKAGYEPFYMICPQKNSVYPEFFPNVPVRRPDVTALDKIIMFFKENEEFSSRYVDVKNLFQSPGIDAPPYYKTDFHWNDYAGALAGKALMEVINDRLGTDVYWPYEIVPIARNDLTGRIAGQQPALAIFSEIKETAYSVINSDGELPSYTYIGDPSRGENKLPSALMFHNSYGDGMLRAGFSDVFTSLVESHNYDSETSDMPKIVIVQIIESGISSCDSIIDDIMKTMSL
jgi:hypothetical protein